MWWKLGGEAALAVVIGIACYLVLFSIRSALFIEEAGLVAQDIALSFRADTVASDASPPFVLIDFDQANFRRLGFPSVTPREKIGRVISLARSGKPALIVVDIDFGWPSVDADEAFLEQELAAAAADAQTPILLVRQPLRASSTVAPTLLKRTRFDELVDGSQNLVWVSALAPIDADGVARRYLSGRSVCRDQSRVVLPNIQLGACVALRGSGAVTNLKKLLVTEGACRSGGAPNIAAHTIQCAGHNWRLASEGSSRILYQMRWTLPVGNRRPEAKVEGQPHKVEEVTVLNALDLLDHENRYNAAELFGNRVVIVGTSAPDIGDVYRTSIGVMPGFMVMANGIRSGLEGGPIEPGEGFYWGAGATAIMSLLTFVLWLGLRRISGYGAIIFKYVAFAASTTLWFVFATLLYSSGHVLEFVFPQYLVTAYLIFVSSWRDVV